MVLQRYEKEPSHFENHFRTLLVGITLLLGTLSIFEWSSSTHIIFHLLAFAVIVILLGVIFRESRYRWGAFVLFGVAIVWVFIHALRLSPGLQFLSFAVFAAILLPISWFYSQHRLKKTSSQRNEEVSETEEQDEHE